MRRRPPIGDGGRRLDRLPADVVPVDEDKRVVMFSLWSFWRLIFIYQHWDCDVACYGCWLGSPNKTTKMLTRGAESKASECIIYDNVRSKAKGPQVWLLPTGRTVRASIPVHVKYSPRIKTIIYNKTEFHVEMRPKIVYIIQNFPAEDRR